MDYPRTAAAIELKDNAHYIFCIASLDATICICSVPVEDTGSQVARVKA